MTDYRLKVLEEVKKSKLLSCEIEDALDRRLQSTSTQLPEIACIQIWAFLIENGLTECLNVETHLNLFNAIYSVWSKELFGPPPVFIPSSAWVESINVSRFMKTYNGSATWLQARTGDASTDWTLLQKESVEEPETFWPAVFAELCITFNQNPSKVLQTHEDPDQIRWFPDARLNVAHLALTSPRVSAMSTALITAHEGHPTMLVHMSRAHLLHEASLVAAALQKMTKPGDAIGIVMPMNASAVIIYLGIILAGCVVVSVPESFSAHEVAQRLQIAHTTLAFTQDVMMRAGKTFELYKRVLHDSFPRAVVVELEEVRGSRHLSKLRLGDITWAKFRASVSEAEVQAFEPHIADAYDMTNILFSSGTTAQPKAIPWNHLTPLRGVVNSWAHQDLRPHDVLAWPSSLGWMMGPWAVFSALMNGCALALYQGAPLGRDFGEFVCAARVNVLGVVPSMVRQWRSSGALDGLDLSSIRCISSTGEASSPDDYFWLSAKIGYRPIIEYCGGTEIGGAFLSSVQLRPLPVSVFNTPTLGASLVLLAGEGGAHQYDVRASNGTWRNSEQACSGELAVCPPLFGSSQHLLNKDHHKVYFADMPRHHRSGVLLRKHGDEIARLPGGHFCALGRVDDTMNLGGIKVGSVEIERVVLEAVPAVHEVAAVGVPTPGGGPERLMLVVVPQPGASPATQQLLQQCQQAVKEKLNPMFKVESVMLRSNLPRTASNKVMRRLLRDELMAPRPRL